MIGEIRIFSFGFAPYGWMPCDGRTVSISSFLPLFSIVGSRFGGDGILNFGLPDLRGFTPIGSGDGPGLEPEPLAAQRSDLAPGDQSRHPRLHLNCCINYDGEFPSRN